MGLEFEILAVDGQARRGRLRTPHGEIATPAFQPVATLGAVKGVPSPWVAEAGAQILLSNLYHLSVRPGIEAIADLGGLHRFIGWSGPLLTDSGGFQVFSLTGLRTVDEDGVTFRSHLDGAELRFTPESVVEAQRRLGVDIAMMLDECPPYPVERQLAEAALARTNRWAARAREEWNRAPGPGGLFGIAQGSVFPDLRRRAAGELAAMEFDGYAIGGVSVGEPTAERRSMVEVTAPELPEEKVRYLMGVGTPVDIVSAVSHGVDLFDCVLPTRNARHGLLFTRQGLLRIKNARFRGDERPIDDACGCPACRHCGRAFLHHLIRSGELTGAVLASLHNLRFYLDFMAEVREAIASGRLAHLAAGVADRYGADRTADSRLSPDTNAEK